MGGYKCKYGICSHEEHRSAPQPSSEGREADEGVTWDFIEFLAGAGQDAAITTDIARMAIAERAAREAAEAERDSLFESLQEMGEWHSAAEQRVAILEEQSEVQGQRAEDAEAKLAFAVEALEPFDYCQDPEVDDDDNPLPCGCDGCRVGAALAAIRGETA